MSLRNKYIDAYNISEFALPTDPHDWKKEGREWNVTCIKDAWYIHDSNINMIKMSSKHICSIIHKIYFYNPLSY